MSWTDCLRDAVKDGRLRQEAADQAIELFDEIEESLKNTMHADAATIEAGLRAYKALQHEAFEKKRRELLRIKNWQGIAKNMKEYRNARGEVDPAAAMLAHLDRDEFAGFSNLEARRKRVLGALHGKMDNVLATFRRNIAGEVREKALLDDLAREAFGEDTGNAAAKELAQAWSETAEYARQRFNAAGGRIPKRADWGMPQTHDSLKVRQTAYSEWRDFIAPKLDLQKMIDEATGQPFTPERLEFALREVYETIRSEGIHKMQPSGQPRGKTLASRHADHRFLAFKSADEWLEYQKRFGGNDVYSTMMAHLEGMSRDIAALEILGPNPQATLRFMEQFAKKWGAENNKIDKVNRAGKLARDMYGIYSGGTNAPIDGRIGRGFAGLRQVLQSAQLGAAAISAITDLNYGRIARAHSGIPQAKVIPSILKMLNPVDLSDQRLAVRSGLIAENWSSVAFAQTRYLGDISGPEISRRMADFVMRTSGLSPWTQGGRWAFGMDFMGMLADNAGKVFDELHPDLQSTMRRYGIDGDHWEVMRATGLYEYKGALFLRPDDIATRGDLEPGFADNLADRFMEMIQSETEFAVPSTSLRGRAGLIGEARPGTVQGELLRSFAMYKSFAVTLFHTHVARMVHQKGAMARGRYAANLVISTTLMGALALQLKEISKGRDPRPMNGENAGAFWGAALLQGGGLGIFGDFLFGGLNRFGGGLPETIAGPVAGFGKDTIDLTLGNLAQVAAGENTNAGNDLVRYLRRYTPGGSLWYARLGYERLVLDELQKAIDPDASRRFRNLERKYSREFNQGYWWEPGDNAPARAPEMSNAVEAR
jgi:hypothetical protein